MLKRKHFLLAQSVGLITLLIGLFWNVPATGGTLQTGLQNKLNNMGPDDVETVIVVMANQRRACELRITDTATKLSDNSSGLMCRASKSQANRFFM